MTDLKTATKSASPKTMAELVKVLGDELIPYRQNEVVEVRVLSSSKDAILVDVADLATGIIPEKEFSLQAAKLKPGDTVNAFVLSPENDHGYVVLSLKRAEKERLWTMLEQRNTSGDVLPVRIVQANKGGLVAEFNDMQGFIPVSQLSFRHYPRVGGDRTKIQQKLGELIGQTLNVKVISYDKANNKIVFSEKATGDSDLEERAKSYQVGEKVTAKVTGVVDFGLFVDLGEIEGLIHISQVSWHRINNLRDHYKPGDEVEAEIISVEDGRISLSIKKLLPDPWQTEAKELHIGGKVKGEVTKVTPYGAFVKISENLDGLLHISQVIGEKKLDELVKEGGKYSFEIITIEPELRKISLKLTDDSAKKDS